MAPPDTSGYTVQTGELMRKAYYVNEAAEKFYKKAKPACESAAIPYGAWPMLGWISAAGNFDTALHTTAACVDASDRGIRAIDVALQKVATAYMRAEKGSTIGGMKTDLSIPQPYKSAPSGPTSSDLENVGSFTSNAVVDTALVLILSNLLQATSAVSGAATIVLLVNTAVIYTNVRLPMPFWAASGHLDNVKSAVEGARGNLTDHTKEFGDNWQGKAYDDFSSYMSNFTSNMLPPLSTMASDLSTAANTVGNGLVSFFFEIVGADLAALVLLAAEAAAAGTVVGTPAAIAAQWATVGLWATAIIAIAKGLWDMVSSIEGTLNSAKNSASTLAASFFSDSEKLEDSKMAPPPTLTSDIKWNVDWVKKK